jgi:hypothetical protein
MKLFLDYTTLSTLSTLTPSDSKSVDAALKRVPILISKQQEVEKNEVLGKLKELGNGVLGSFPFFFSRYGFILLACENGENLN